MIDAVMYGPTPSMIIDRLESPLPEKILIKFNSWLDSKKAANLSVGIPGTGTLERNL